MEWLWAFALLALLFGPIVLVAIRTALGRRQGVPRHEQQLEAHGMAQFMKDWIDSQTTRGSG